MERVFIGATRAEATRKADEWWGRQKGLRQTLRTEVAVGGKGPDTAHADRWAITIRFEDENFGAEWRWQGRQSGAVRFLDRLKIIVPRHPRDPVRYTELSPTRFKDFWRE